MVIILDHAETPLHNLCLETLTIGSESKIVAVIADVRSKKALEKVFKNYSPHVVFHAAAYKHVPLMEENPSQAIQTNIKGTKNLADLSCKHHVKKFSRTFYILSLVFQK